MKKIKVYCSKCWNCVQTTYYKEEGVIRCRSDANTIELYGKDNWYEHKVSYKHKAKPSVINKNNDCKDYVGKSSTGPPL